MSVDLTDIVKSYPGTLALDCVSATFRFDEVHGVVGENGAGKSTFVNVLGGSIQPSAGSIKIDGNLSSFASPREALEAGIAHVSQEGSLVSTFTGAENIMLGAEPLAAGGVLRHKALKEEAAALAKKWFPDVELTLDRPVEDLPMADRKVIEIIRALRGDIRLLILDEPTATLEAREKKQLWDIIRRLPKLGVGVVLISHFLTEIVALSDTVTVLRDGKRVANLRGEEASEAQLADLMLRREGTASAGIASTKNQHEAQNLGATVLNVKDWHVGKVKMREFELRAGEIVGLIGLTGAGHFGFARSLYTGQGLLSGDIEVSGQVVETKDVRNMQKAGVALVPDLRMENALAGQGSLQENLTMVHASYASRFGILTGRKERDEVDRVIASLNIKTPTRRQLIKNLSGGNKQKVSIGKWLYGAEGRYQVLIFIEPTEGVDIGAKQEIYGHMRRLAASGAAILIASSDLSEIAQVCHRALPFVHGQPQAGIAAAEFSEGRFISAISGEAA